MKHPHVFSLVQALSWRPAGPGGLQGLGLSQGFHALRMVWSSYWEIYDGCSSHFGLPEGIYYHHVFPYETNGAMVAGVYIYIFDKLISGEHVSKPAFKANKVGWGLP